MQITNSVVCDTSNDNIYKQIKPPIVGEHAFPPTGFVCKEAYVTVALPQHHGVRPCCKLVTNFKLILNLETNL